MKLLFQFQEKLGPLDFKRALSDVVKQIAVPEMSAVGLVGCRVCLQFVIVVFPDHTIFFYKFQVCI